MSPPPQASVRRQVVEELLQTVHKVRVVLVLPPQPEPLASGQLPRREQQPCVHRPLLPLRDAFGCHALPLRAVEPPAVPASLRSLLELAVGSEPLALSEERRRRFLLAQRRELGVVCERQRPHQLLVDQPPEDAPHPRRALERLQLRKPQLR